MSNTYEVVRQHTEDGNYFTIFQNQSQYCDDDGNPIRYETYEDAISQCNKLNERSQDMNTFLIGFIIGYMIAK